MKKSVRKMRNAGSRVDVNTSCEAPAVSVSGRGVRMNRKFLAARNEDRRVKPEDFDEERFRSGQDAGILGPVFRKGWM